LFKFWIKDRSYYKKLCAIALPLGFSNLINVALTSVGSLMLGQIGEVALSGSSLANQIGHMNQIMNLGLTAGAAVLTSQYWGRQDTGSIKKVMTLTFRIAFLIGMIFTLLALFIPHTLMRFYTNDPAIMEAGVLYLKYMAFSYLPVGFAMAASTAMRSVGEVKFPMYTYCVSFVLNVFLNWVFIFGHLGMPAMGIAGSGIATLSSRILECAMIVGYLFCFEKRIQFHPRNLLDSVDRRILKLYLKYGAPVLCNEVVWSIGSTMLSVFMGHIGASYVSANSIATTLYQCVTVVNYGIAQGASVMAGHTIGEGKYQRAKDESLTIFVLSIGFGLASAGVCWLLRIPFIDLYNITEETRDIALIIVGCMCGMTPFQALFNINMFGTLRGGGDSKYVMVFDIVSMWCFSVPVGYLAAFVFDAPVALVYLGLRCGDLFKCVGTIVRILPGKWIKDVTRTDEEKQQLAEAGA